MTQAQMTYRKQHRPKDKRANRLPVDPSKLQMGNTYESPPEYYYDIPFTCRDCGSSELWTAAQQKWWYEEAGGYFFTTAIRCRPCRQAERQRKQEARELQNRGTSKANKEGT